MVGFRVLEFMVFGCLGVGFGFRVLGLRHVCLLWGFVGQQGPCSGFSRFKALG